jgi:hypothetical protein
MMNIKIIPSKNTFRASNKIIFCALNIPPYLPFPKGGIPLFGPPPMADQAEGVRGDFLFVRRS